ncbi:hypothetical protein QZH41_019215 [Actinostola sp. cb2023]|nr:hypothetical protein QZH41_019215 [Actinostola sp. cb2023]
MEAIHKIKDEINEMAEKRPPSYCIVLDNFDIRIEVSDMTSDNQNKDKHWCNHNAITDRVNPNQYSDDKPIADILHVPNKVIVPKLEDNKALMDDFVVLVARVFVEHFDSFSIFKDIVPTHIKHKHSDEMKKKTNKVNMGIIFKDENLGEDMIDIVRELHQWVPSTDENEEEETFDRVPVVGDQKTMERGVEAQFSVSNSYSRRRRLDGLYFQLADWHHENKFLAVCTYLM